MTRPLLFGRAQLLELLEVEAGGAAGAGEEAGADGAAVAGVSAALAGSFASVGLDSAPDSEAVSELFGA